MLISQAFAQETPATTATTAVPTGAPPVTPKTASPGEAFMMNMVMVLILVALFWLLLIRPQQKRFKEHANMLGQLGPGSKIVTQGGLVGTIEKTVSDHEVIVDLGNNFKVTLLRSSIMGRYEDAVRSNKPANDDSKNKKAS